MIRRIKSHSTSPSDLYEYQVQNVLNSHSYLQFAYINFIIQYWDHCNLYKKRLKPVVMQLRWEKRPSTQEMMRHVPLEDGHASLWL